MTNFLNDINKEKQDIIKTDGNVLVTANPGTGKTRLLAYKFIYLLTKGIKEEDILCLTFTNKAKKELENRIIDLIKKVNIKADLSKLNIHTFHSYTLSYMEEDTVVSSNLLRYSIYQYLKEKEILNYSDDYLIETIVPKMENLLRYLKNFNILPEKINIKKVKSFIEGNEKYSKEELEKFAEDFINIFRHYEEIKSKKGIDYTDMLINFFKIKNPKKFKYVLIDELQDVNTIEADIALNSAEHFVAVGDKKQSIFGFQGGSIINFKKFSKAKNLILSENFRNSNEVLNYAKEFFVSKTKEESHKIDLKNLKNTEADPSEEPKIYEIPREEKNCIICELAKKLSKEKKVAIIARTNYQIMEISKELSNRGIDHSSTFFSASKDAKESIISFLKGILSNDVQIIKNSMFTPFFPISVQKAFEVANAKTKTIEDIYSLCPEFKRLRESIVTMQDIDILFKERIIPISISYGREFFLAALNINEALQEALKVIDSLDMKNIIDYLSSSDLLADSSDIEKQIILTTVHKAKGKEYDYVIYAPSKTRDSSNFQDSIVEAILMSEGIDAKEELEEESLRIDFVAFTRAKCKLFIVTDKPQDYMNQFSSQSSIETESIESFDLAEKAKRAYSFFLNKEYDKAKALLETDNSWLIKSITSHFKNLDHISYSSLKDNAYSYLIENILKMKEFSASANFGNEVHEIAKVLSEGKDIEVEEQYQPYKENIQAILKEIKPTYPELVEVEEEIKIPMSELIQTKDPIMFSGRIDAVFKNNNSYIIIDWKTDKKDENASKHRQQLDAYRHAYSIKKNIPISNIKVAIGFIGLRRTINTGTVEREFDANQPRASAFGTFAKKVSMILSWRENPESFFNDLIEEKTDDSIWRAVVEQYMKEKK